MPHVPTISLSSALAGSTGATLEEGQEVEIILADERVLKAEVPEEKLWKVKVVISIDEYDAPP